jgi:chromate transport protein ChrA
MILIRILLLAFNVGIVAYLIYRILQIQQTNNPNKTWIILISIFLLFLPATMLMGLIRPSAVYLLLYPVAIGVHLYLIRNS